MKNDEIKALRARVKQGEPLTKDEQLLALRDLEISNQLIQEARRAGYLQSELEEAE
ncbi:hypothetical protein [Enterovirga rhinocerotis]|uniref:Uncharacterized protein n=1 Tax=Enterovirga rhinocerotis TaxID=1339210 RepID=A0A4R7C9G9_9HYPH|nr:hypothetical protein [Enterovirga rhinocerotis]TDR95299.1 hypothetical protein EV668_0117 [Enterovirga rhinocerotis]